MRGRNYSLRTLHADATILDVSSANLTLGLLHVCPSLGLNRWQGLAELHTSHAGSSQLL
jgi:hypothetical protein